MTHLDSNALATYNSLVDPHLQCYFSNERIRSHLKHAGLIGRRGEIISDSEYRSKLSRKEHKKHVRQVLAENIVHRAIDMERARQAELRRQLDMVSKAALVNSVKESRRRAGYSLGHVSHSNDMNGPSMHSSWSQNRPKSANHQQEIEILNDELISQPRVQSAHVHDDHRRKHLSKSPVRRSRYLNRPKSTTFQRSSPSQRPRSPIKPSDPSLANPPCKITMIYYGPHTKIDYDQTLFEPVDEVMVMQQHCGGENLIVYKSNLKAEEEFTFNSRRHSDYPFGLSLYVKGLIDSRISTCCEYKHRHGVRLGGERGHFAIVSVEGSKPCIKCRFEKQTRLKQHDDANETDDENKKAIVISIPVSDQLKRKQKSVKIPVRHTSDSNENYSEDFDEPQKKSGHTRSKSPTELSSTTTEKSEEDSSTKTWQIIFHTSNIPTGSLNLPKNAALNALLKFSFISMNGKDQTEEYEIELNDFPQCFKSGRQDSFRAKLKNIGKPKQIRLKIDIPEDEYRNIKWHLDHIEVIDPKTQSHYKFPCKQWIHPSEEKILNQSDDSLRKSSSSTNNSKSSFEKKPKSPSRSSSSSYESPNRLELIKKPIVNPTRRISTDNESNDQKNLVHYQILIYPSKDTDGEFNASNDSRIFLRLNNQTKDSYLYRKGTKYCPSFQSGENQTFDINLKLNNNEPFKQLTFGYYNSDITAGKWKIEKIVLINTETNERTTFTSKQSLERNDFNLRAEQTFQVQDQKSDDDDEQSTPRNVDENQLAKNSHHRSSSSESAEDNEYNRMFKQNKDAEPSSSRPKTRRGVDKNSDQETNQGDTLTRPKENSDVWRPSSQLESKDPVDPLVGLNDIQNESARSTNPKKSSVSSNESEDQFKNWYRDDNEDEN